MPNEHEHSDDPPSIGGRGYAALLLSGAAVAYLNEFEGQIDRQHWLKMAGEIFDAEVNR